MLPENHEELKLLLDDREQKHFDDVPIKQGQKAPTGKGWSEIERYNWTAFAGKGIGCRGSRIVALDIDDVATGQIALAVFNVWLPSALVWDGRASRPLSHLYIYVPDGAPRLSRDDSPFTRANYRLPLSGSGNAIEVKHHRGLQALTAPSVHPSGEELYWYSNADVASGAPCPLGETPAVPSLPAHKLEQALHCIWLARALSMVWAEGSRHHGRLWLGTWLCKSGVRREDAVLIWMGLLAVCPIDASYLRQGEAEFFRAWDQSGDNLATHRGISGVRELAQEMFGDKDAQRWFESIYRIWPALRSSSVGIVDPSACDNDTLWTPGGKALYERMRQECTLLTPAQGEAAIYDPEMHGSCQVRTYRQRAGRIGQNRENSRGTTSFVHVVDLWLESRDKRVACNTAYLPQLDYNAISSDGLLNLFCRGPIWSAALTQYRIGVDDVGEQEVTWFIDWLARVIPDEVERQTFIHWIGALLLRPWELRGWAPYMAAYTHGIGRTSIMVVLERIMGAANVYPISNEALQSSFTDWAERGVLRYVNETRESGKTRGVVAKRLHEPITDARLMINRKRKTVIQVPNHGGYILIANNLGDMHLTDTSRRFFCVTCGERKPSGAEKRTFWAHAGNEKTLQRLAQWLLQAAVELPTEAPRTATWHAVVEMSRTGTEEAILEAIEDFGRIFSMAQFAERYDGPGSGLAITGNRYKTLWGILRSANYVKVRAHDNRVVYKGRRVTVYAHERDMSWAVSLKNKQILGILEANEANFNDFNGEISNVVSIKR